MPEETIRIGSRDYQVACQPGEERLLQAAARLLDAEAEAVASRAGRMPENRALLMAGLMLADKFAGMEDQLREKEARIRELERELSRMREAPGERVEVPVVPRDLLDAMDELAAKAESMAAMVETKAAQS